jgi:hypothetical protein
MINKQSNNIFEVAKLYNSKTTQAEKDKVISNFLSQQYNHSNQKELVALMLAQSAKVMINHQVEVTDLKNQLGYLNAELKNTIATNLQQAKTINHLSSILHNYIEANIAEDRVAAEMYAKEALTEIKSIENQKFKKGEI